MTVITLRSSPDYFTPTAMILPSDLLPIFHYLLTPSLSLSPLSLSADVGFRSGGVTRAAPKFA